MQSDSLHTLIYRLNLNAHALSRTTEEIGDWIGSTTTSPRVFEYLEMIERNSEVIATAMADMVAAGRSRTKR